MERDEYNLKRWKEKRGEEGRRGRGPKEEGGARAEALCTFRRVYARQDR
jgi:hypothetical protein